MKARELRIGNYILYGETHTIFQVMTINEDGYTVKNDIEETWIEQWAFYGIPLTEDWLVKFGFKKSKHWYTLGDIAIYKDMARLTQKVDGMYVEIYNQFKCPEYVHQLQNLYFALTGEELTIKSNTNDKS